MALCKCTKKAIAVKSRGFSLIELMIVVAITAALALVAIPNIVTALPKYSVKRAASDMSARIRKARTTAVKERRRIVFDFNVALNRYQIDGQWFPEAGGSLDDHYGGGVSFGFGDASINATAGGGGLPADPVTFAGNCFVINERGISDKRGYVYLQNRRGNAYACAVRDMAGSVQVKRWTGSAWWPRN